MKRLFLKEIKIKVKLVITNLINHREKIPPNSVLPTIRIYPDLSRNS